MRQAIGKLLNDLNSIGSVKIRADFYLSFFLDSHKIRVYNQNKYKKPLNVSSNCEEISKRAELGESRQMKLQ